MKNPNQPIGDYQNVEELRFDNASDDEQDRRDAEEAREKLAEELEEKNGDWGDVDPAGGEAPTAPGSAV